MPDPAWFPPHEIPLQNDAVEFFVDRARAVKPDFTLHRGQAAAVIALCAYVDGLPLAIEMAATHMRSQSPQELLTSLASRLDVETRNVDGPDRHQTLRATFDCSYQLLPPGPRRLVAQIAVFIGGCTADDIAAVCLESSRQNDAAHQLEVLAHHNWLKHTASAQGVSHYGMLETIREYAWERLEASGERELLRDRHAMHYLALAEAALPKPSGPERAHWLGWLEQQHRNVGAALDWMLTQQHVDPARRLCNALWPFWNETNYVYTGRRWIEAVLAASGEREDLLQASLLLGASALAHSEADYPAALAHWQAAYTSYVQHGDRRGIATALVRQGITYRGLGEQQEAAARFEQGLRIRQQLEDKAGMAEALHLLGNALYSQVEFARAEECFAASQQLYMELGDQYGVAVVLLDAGLCAIFQNEFHRAQAILGQALHMLGTLLGRDWEATAALAHLGFATLFAGDHERARQLTTQCLSIRRQQGDKIGISYNLDALAGVAIAEGSIAPPTAAHDKFARAARLAGAHALRHSIKAPFNYGGQPLYERYRNIAYEAIGETLFKIYFAEGSTKPLDDMIAYALES